jgi:hypothetical protein
MKRNIPSLTEFSLKAARETAPAWATENDIRLMVGKLLKQVIDDGLFKCVGYNDDGVPIYRRT